MIDEPNRSACLKIYNDNSKLFYATQGSTYNHQAWIGGYADHITEAMNICICLYTLYSIRLLNFTLSDALLVIFLHDLEKPWLNQIIDPHERVRPILSYFENKKKRKVFRDQKMKEYKLLLTEQHINALKYVEGENDDYSSKKRIMNELAAFCHLADVSSARIWYDYGKEGKW